MEQKEIQEMVILKSDGVDGPEDGIIGVTSCLRTDFDKDDENKFSQLPKSEAHISTSVGLGLFSVRDMGTGVMLTCRLEDVYTVLVEAVKRSREVDGVRTEEQG